MGSSRDQRPGRPPGMSLFPTARPAGDARSSPGGWSPTGVEVSVARASGGGPHGGTAGGEEGPWCRTVDADRHSGTLARRRRQTPPGPARALVPAIRGRSLQRGLPPRVAVRRQPYGLLTSDPTPLKPPYYG